MGRRGSRKLVNMHKKRGWFRCPQTDPSIPSVPGIYAFFEYGIVVYVGSSENLRRRIKQHQPKGDGIIAVCPCHRPGDHLRREYRLIKKLMPAWNRRHAWGSADSGVTVERDMREYY